MIDAGLCRNEVNKRTGRIVRAFKRAVGEELIPPSVHHGLRAVSGLRRGRADVKWDVLQTSSRRAVMSARGRSDRPDGAKLAVIVLVGEGLD